LSYLSTFSDITRRQLFGPSAEVWICYQR